MLRFPVIITKKTDGRHSDQNPGAAVSSATGYRSASTLCHTPPRLISNRKLTMRAWASRESNSSRGICFAHSNRELHLLEPDLSCCKQTQLAVPNRELSPIYNHAIPSKTPPQNFVNPTNFYR